MRILAIAMVVLAGWSFQANAHHSGVKSKKYSSANKAYSNRKAYRGRHFRGDRRSAVGSRYQYQDYPIWAAKAFEPRSLR